jgi:hypothetical protein
MTLKAHAIVIPFAVINIPRTGTLLELSRSPIVAESVPQQEMICSKSITEKDRGDRFNYRSYFASDFDERF